MGGRPPAGYVEQISGLDTVDANTALGLPIDARRYDGAIALLRRLGVTGVRLLTNNPDKIRALRERGLAVEPVPLVIPTTPESAGYFEAKRDRLRHRLPLELPTQDRG